MAESRVTEGLGGRCAEDAVMRGGVHRRARLQLCSQALGKPASSGLVIARVGPTGQRRRTRSTVWVWFGYQRIWTPFLKNSRVNQ